MIRLLHAAKAKPGDMRWGISFIITALMLLLIFVSSLMLVSRINTLEREKSFNRLYEEAQTIGDYIEMLVNNDREQLQLLATMLEQTDDFTSPRLWHLLDAYDRVGFMSRLQILLLGDKLVAAGGQVYDASGKLSFAQEAADGAHVTNRETDFFDPDVYVVRHYMPIERAGKIVALLCGVVSLTELPVLDNLQPYSGQGAMYIVDGANGDFLMDTWHPGRSGNIWALGERQTAPGYSSDRFKEQVRTGESGSIVFISRTTGEYLYLHSRAININAWRVSISVPDSVVFASAKTIARWFNLFLGFELLCFCLYLIWMIRTVREVTRAKQQRIEMFAAINGIEKLLFNAHEDLSRLHAALRQLGSRLYAQQVYFALLSQGEVQRLYTWSRGSSVEESSCNELEELWRELIPTFAAGQALYTQADPAALRRLLGAQGANCRTLTALPVHNASNGHICAMLLCTGIKLEPLRQAFLQAISFSLGLFCDNMHHRFRLQEQGDRDSLTGLYNRNRYERDLAHLAAAFPTGLGCLYLDVNGLHELNNKQGHAAGDAMLRCVAAGIVRYFSSEYQYRIGGDEFVLFFPAADAAALAKAGQALRAELLKADYHISMGFACDAKLRDLNGLIKTAEQRMYRDKQAFYAQSGSERRAAR